MAGLPATRVCWTLVALWILGGVAGSPFPAAATEPAGPGVLLVASAELRDPNFRQTVVLVTRHQGGPPVGVILNRPTTAALGPLFPDHPHLRTRTERVSVGGPVAPHTMVFVFRPASPPGGSLPVMDDVYMTLSPALIDGLLGQPLGLLDLRAFAGYAGWIPGQLEAEIAQGGWHVLPPDVDTIFRADPATMWRNLLRRATSRTVRAQSER